MADLINLKRTAADKKAEKDRYKVGPQSDDDYDYSTRLNLSGSTLEKLDLDVSKLKVGQTFTFTGKAFVKSLSSNKGNGLDNDTLCLQMTHLAVEPTAKGGAVDALSAGIEDAEDETNE